MTSVSGFKIQTLEGLQRLGNYQNVTTQALQEKLDTDHNGEISNTEAEQAGLDPSDTEAVNEAFKSHLSDPKAVVFGEHQLRVQGASQVLTSIFNTLDSDSNGFISRKELNQALRDPAWKGRDAAAIATLYQCYDKLQEASDDEIGPENDGIHLKDVQAMAVPGKDEAQKIGAQLARNQIKLRHTDRHIFPNGLNSIRPDNVKQGYVGDCFFIAGIAAKASTQAGKEAINKMIQANQDGTYTVTFPGGKPITIQEPTEAEIALYSGASKDGLWLSVLEKAYAQSTNHDAWLKKENPYEKIDEGGGLDEAIKVMTGRSSDSDWLGVSSLETLRTKLQASFSKDKLVLAAIKDTLILPSGAKSHGLTVNHAYAVLGYDPVTDKVTLRNALGQGEPMNKDKPGEAADGKLDGNFTMTLTEFKEYFSLIAFEE